MYVQRNDGGLQYQTLQVQYLFQFIRLYNSIMGASVFICMYVTYTHLCHLNNKSKHCTSTMLHTGATSSTNTCIIVLHGCLKHRVY